MCHPDQSLQPHLTRPILLRLITSKGPPCHRQGTAHLQPLGQQCQQEHPPLSVVLDGCYQHVNACHNTPADELRSFHPDSQLPSDGNDSLFPWCVRGGVAGRDRVSFE